MEISVVIPCYNSQNTIEKLVNLICIEFNKININNYEIILVNDYSKDETLTVLKKISELNKDIKVIDLANNFGQHSATMAGLNFAKGDIILSMDDDLQMNPSQINKLINKLNEGYDVVFGNFYKKKHSFYRNVLSRLNQYSLEKLINKPKDIQITTFWIVKKYVKDSMIAYKGSYAHTAGLILRTTKSITSIKVDHEERKEGKSNYTFLKMFKLWSSFTNFSIIPLRFATILGFVFSLLSFIFAIYFGIRKFVSDQVLSGWSSTIVVILFFSGIILFSIGILGEYIGRIYLSLNVQPQYIVRELINIDSND